MLFVVKALHGSDDGLGQSLHPIHIQIAKTPLRVQAWPTDSSIAHRGFTSKYELRPCLDVDPVSAHIPRIA